MIKREKYIKEIRPFYESDLIKIITGVRRSGKSIILEQIKEEISSSNKNIIYLDFDDRATTSFISNWEDIIKYVNENRSDGICYVFLDEVQEIENWFLACRSLRRENCSVFITGSNSNLLSGEFTKELSGRYVSFRIRPFIYKEIDEYARQLGKTIGVSEYLKWGGFPKCVEFSDENAIRRYLNDLDETIVVNDIIKRYKIRKTDEFRKFVNFLLICNAREYSANSIAETLKINGLSCSTNTIQKWVLYLEEAYIVDEIPTFSTKAKKQLDYAGKLYNCDVALNSIRKINNRYDLSHNFENIIYNELLYMGYSLEVYDNKGKKIDFLATKDNKKYYVQAAYSVVEEKAYNREFSAYNGLSQLDRKIIITNDDIDFSTSNVQHIKFKDFLLMNSLDENTGY